MYRFAVLGLGQDGLHHIGALRNMDISDCTAVYDKDSLRVRAAMDAYPGLRGYTDAEDLFSSEVLDGVTVTASDEISDMVRLASSYVPNILAELPDTMSVEDFDALTALCGEKGVAFSCYQPGRFDKYYRTIKDCCEKKAAGTVVTIKRNLSEVKGRLWQMVDQLLSLVDSPVAEVDAASGVRLSLRFLNDVTAEAGACDSLHKWSLRGDEWTIHLDEGIRFAGWNECSYLNREKAVAAQDDCYLNYFNVLEGKDEPCIGLEDVRRALKVLESVPDNFSRN